LSSMGCTCLFIVGELSPTFPIYSKADADSATSRCRLNAQEVCCSGCHISTSYGIPSHPLRSKTSQLRVGVGLLPPQTCRDCQPVFGTNPLLCIRPPNLASPLSALHLHGASGAGGVSAASSSLPKGSSDHAAICRELHRIMAHRFRSTRPAVLPKSPISQEASTNRRKFGITAPAFLALGKLRQLETIKSRDSLSSTPGLEVSANSPSARG